MAQRYPDHIWHNGAIKPWAEATTHVMAHALHYGSSVFEGIRSYAHAERRDHLPPHRSPEAAVPLGEDLRHGASRTRWSNWQRRAAR